MRTGSTRPSASARRSVAVLALVLAGPGAGCRSGRPAFPRADLSDAARGFVKIEELRLKAWAPRRLKALFGVEVVPKLGVTQRGYLSLFWDGTAKSMTWRTSLPVAGELASGRISLGGGTSGLAHLLSSRLSDADALSVLLGAPAEPCDGPVERDGGSLRFTTADRERVMVLGPGGEITAMELPGAVEVRLEAGPDLPRRIEIRTGKGRATLDLKEASPWEGPLPGDGS